MHARPFLVALAVVVLIVAGLAACAPTAATSPTLLDGTAAPASIGAGAGGGAPASPASGAPGPESPGAFGRHDTAPGGVAEFLDFRGGGGGSCVAEEPGPPSVRLEVANIPVAVCAFNFVPGEDVDLLLRGPDGSESTSRQRADESGTAIWDLDDLPDPIEGDYVLGATQGERSAQGSSTVAFDKLVVGLLPDGIRIGETIRLLVAGGQPLSSVPAFLYFAPQGYTAPDGSPGYRFAADIGPIELDANGEGRLALATRPGDPPGPYAIVVDPPPIAAPTPMRETDPAPMGSMGPYVDLAEAAGLTCSEAQPGDCDGEVGGVHVITTISTDDRGVVDSVWAMAGGASDETIALFGGMARVATGVAAAESWVMSATTTAERRFGDVNVALTEESDGSWQIFVDAGLPSPDGERVDFEVHP